MFKFNFAVDKMHGDPSGKTSFGGNARKRVVFIGLGSNSVLTPEERGWRLGPGFRQQPVLTARQGGRRVRSVFCFI